MTYTTLRLGTPKFKERPKERHVPLSVSPCIEPSTILRDSGFETHIATTGGGPTGNEIPGETGEAFTIWSDDTMATDLTGWAAFDVMASSGTRYWEASTASPRSGTYHARYIPNPAIQPASYLTCIGGYPCSPISAGFQGVSATVSTGDYFRFGIWVKATEIAMGATAEPGFIMNYTFFCPDALGDDGEIIDFGEVLTTAYQYFEVDGFVPDAVGLGFDVPFSYIQFRPEIYGGDPSTNTLRFDMDDAEMDIL